MVVKIRNSFNGSYAKIALFLLLVALTACQPAAPQMPTAAIPAEIGQNEQTAPQSPTLIATWTPIYSEPPPTWTAVPTIVQQQPTHTAVAPAPDQPTAVASETPFIPTNTPQPTATATATPTATPEPTIDPFLPTLTPSPIPITPLPTLPSQGAWGNDFLPNGSFEETWYHMNGLPELQLPQQWAFSWEEGRTGYGNDPWDQWYRPETRVMPARQLPPHERPLFIRDGVQTIKVFKGGGPISFSLYQYLSLEPGTYRLTIRAFPDLIMEYEDDQKVWADDPLAGEVRLIAPNFGSGWLFPTFGTWNSFQHIFTLEQTTTVQLGVDVRSRFALVNNGWFFDDWDLQRMETP